MAEMTIIFNFKGKLREEPLNRVVCQEKVFQPEKDDIMTVFKVLSVNCERNALAVFGQKKEKLPVYCEWTNTLYLPSAYGDLCNLGIKSMLEKKKMVRHNGLWRTEREELKLFLKVDQTWCGGKKTIHEFFHPVHDEPIRVLAENVTIASFEYCLRAPHKINFDYRLADQNGNGEESGRAILNLFNDQVTCPREYHRQFVEPRIREETKFFKELVLLPLLANIREQLEKALGQALPEITSFDTVREVVRHFHEAQQAELQNEIFKVLDSGKIEGLEKFLDKYFRSLTSEELRRKFRIVKRLSA